MLTRLSFQNFKSWRDTGDIAMAPLTGFFGANSSGKTSILHFLLMLKQTVESSDRERILDLGDERTYVDLRTTYDILYNHQLPGDLVFSLDWENDKFNFTGTKFSRLNFSCKIECEIDQITVREFLYKIIASDNSCPLKQVGVRSQKDSKSKRYDYEFYGLGASTGFSFDNFIPPLNSYSLSSFALRVSKPENVEFVSRLFLYYEDLFQTFYYLGPLREYPRSIYSWSGERPQGVGRRGEFAVSALLASRVKNEAVEERVAYWLKKLGLIHDFQVRPIAANRREYEVKVRLKPNAPEVLITDVGFGVSQVLPVLVLCHYVPKGSTIIFEQPEIHLHPAIQSGLADVFIDVIKTRGVQIILESHSEHLLNRLQRRIAVEI